MKVLDEISTQFALIREAWVDSTAFKQRVEVLAVEKIFSERVYSISTEFIEAV
jgi:hypothetical protein